MSTHNAMLIFIFSLVKVATKIAQQQKDEPKIQEDNGDSQIKATVPKVDKKTAKEKKKLLAAIKAKRRAILKAVRSFQVTRTVRWKVC